MTAALDRASLTGELNSSGLFDGVWYLQRNGDVAAAGKDPLHHFIEYGWAERRWPNRYFDPATYRKENPDIGAQVDPLLHYIRHGGREGRTAHSMFDANWYRSAYEIPAHIIALAHYIANRSSGRFVPCADLFAVPLIPPYRDDPSRGIDPVAHYLDNIGAGKQDVLPDLSAVLASRLVDENYYLINAADVHEANVDPTAHYCRHGWREQRKPNIYFDPGWYVQTNPELARLKVNPLVHYILVGEAANRRPVPFFDPGWYRAEYNIPDGEVVLRHYLTNRRKQTHSPTPLFDVKWYIDRFGADLGPNRDPFTHFLLAGMRQDIDPSRGFDAGQYRRAHLGRPSRRFLRRMDANQHNPLVHYLRTEYAGRS